MSQRGLKSICSPFQWQLKTETLYHCCSVAKLWLTFRSHGLCNCGTSGSSVFCCLLEFAQIHVHWVDNAIQPSHPLLPSSPFAFSLPRHQGLFQSAGSLNHGFSFFSLSPSSEYSGLISFEIDWFDLLLVQRTLKSLLQHLSQKASTVSLGAFISTT